MGLPHIKNSAAGRNKWEPVFKSLFKAEFDLPIALAEKYGKDTMLLTEHVLSVNDINTDKVPAVVTQKYQFTTRSYSSPIIDDTSIEFSVKFTLNLRNATDNYIWKIFKEWANLLWNSQTGEREIKINYCADSIRITEFNRKGDIYRKRKFYSCFISSPLEGMSGELDYNNAEPVELTVKFKSDYWDEEIA